MPNTWTEPASNDDYPVIPQDDSGDEVMGSPYLFTMPMPTYAGYIELEPGVTFYLKAKPTWYSRLAMRLLGWRWVDTETTNGNATG